MMTSKHLNNNIINISEDNLTTELNNIKNLIQTTTNCVLEIKKKIITDIDIKKLEKKEQKLFVKEIISIFVKDENLEPKIALILLQNNFKLISEKDKELLIRKAIKDENFEKISELSKEDIDNMFNILDPYDKTINIILE
jgi:hypothetical protein